MPVSFLKSRSMYPFLIGTVMAVFLIPILQSAEHAPAIAPYAPYLWIVVVAAPLLVVLGYGAGVLLLGRMNVIREVLRFGVIGASNFAVDSGATQTLIALTGYTDPKSLPFLLLNATAVAMAVGNSYTWNRWWTFGDGGVVARPTFIKFIAVSLGAIAINTATVSLSLQAFYPSGDYPLYALTEVKVIATAVSMTWNFLGYKFLVFKK